MTESAYVVAFAFTLDFIAGDPPNSVHPVSWLGRFAGWIIARLPRTPPGRAFVSGVALVGVVGGLATAIAFGWSRTSEHLPFVVRIVSGALLLKACFALRGLVDAGTTLVETYERDGLEAARSRLSWLCSRDPSGLDADGLANGTVESLAENLSDSVVAPLFYFALFGLPGAAFFRAVNTLDAMVGYRGEFEWLGKSAARLDDVLGLVPARLTAFFLLVASPFVGADFRGGLRVHRRDRMLTESPNAGHPMSMASGLLGVRLDKPGVYSLGADLRPAHLDDVARAARLVTVAAFLFVIVVFFGVNRRG